MTVASHGFRNARLILGLTLALGAAACAQQTAPQASAPSAADLSVQPAGRSTATPASSMQGMQGMDHSNMPGMRGSSAQGGGMQGHNMSGMNMQQMMAHCAEMRQQARPGATMSPDMQAMMQHCSQMGGSTGMQGQGGTRAR